MSRERELLREALYVIGEFTEDAQERGEILITEIKELLAQPEQEPVAWRYKTHNRYTYTEENYHELEGEGELLYATPPKREPLSPAEIIFPEWIFSKDERQAFVAGFRYAEKHYGIGE